MFFQPGLNNSSSIRMKRYSNFSKIISHQSVNEETDARRKQDPPWKEKQARWSKNFFLTMQRESYTREKQTPWSGTVYTLHSRGLIGAEEGEKKGKERKRKKEKEKKEKNCRLRLSFASPTIMKRLHAYSHVYLERYT